jgi:hypothetical protein
MVEKMYRRLALSLNKLDRIVPDVMAPAAADAPLAG